MSTQKLRRQDIKIWRSIRCAVSLCFSKDFIWKSLAQEKVECRWLTTLDSPIYDLLQPNKQASFNSLLVCQGIALPLCLVASLMNSLTEDSRYDNCGTNLHIFSGIRLDANAITKMCALIVSKYYKLCVCMIANLKECTYQRKKNWC